MIPNVHMDVVYVAMPTQVLSAEVNKLADSYSDICHEGNRWTGYLVHSDFLRNFAPDSLSDEGNHGNQLLLNFDIPAWVTLL